MHGSSLEEKLREAATGSLDRLFPRFREADHRAWRLAYDRARAGADTPFQVVDWTGPTDHHSVAREVPAAVGSGCEGRELRKKFAESPYGWPQDALDAAIVALHASGHLTARYKGTTLAVGQLDQTKIPATELRVQAVTLTAQEKIRIRQLFQRAGVQVNPNDPARSAEPCASSASASPAARPRAPPDLAVAELDELEGLAGNERLKRLLDLAANLSDALDHWQAAASRLAERRPTWQRLETSCATAMASKRSRRLAARPRRCPLTAASSIEPNLNRSARSSGRRRTACRGHRRPFALASVVRSGIRPPGRLRGSGTPRRSGPHPPAVRPSAQPAARGLTRQRGRSRAGAQHPRPLRPARTHRRPPDPPRRSSRKGRSRFGRPCERFAWSAQRFVAKLKFGRGQLQREKHLLDELKKGPIVVG